MMKYKKNVLNLIINKIYSFMAFKSKYQSQLSLL